MQKFTIQNLDQPLLHSHFSTIISQQCAHEIVKRAEREIMIREKGKIDGMKKAMKVAETNVILDQINER